MKKRRLKIKNIILVLLIIICLSGFIYSVINIVKWKKDNRHIEKIQEEIKENIDFPTEKIDNEEVSILDSYSIDFDELKKINKEVVGYVKVDNTNIDYTVVKHKDNDYYLNHSFDKKYNSAGWIFSHYKNRYDGSDKNYVIFGHNRKDGSMFGSLKNILTKSWQNKDNKVIFITENSKNIYEVFSVYKVLAEDYYIKTDFKDNKEYEEFLNKIKSRSLKKYDVDLTSNDRILTLSTCFSNNKYRIVLHAKEIKVENE